ncbi:MAG TPA: hypothetical protein VF790_00150 [Dissulfurispiraceae bacterium]
MSRHANIVLLAASLLIALVAASRFEGTAEGNAETSLRDTEHADGSLAAAERANPPAARKRQPSPPGSPAAPKSAERERPLDRLIFITLMYCSGKPYR